MSLSLAPLASLDWTALHSLDLGDIESPDGRAHPVTASIPAQLVSVPAPAPAPAPGPAQGMPNIPIYVPGSGMITIPGSGALVDKASAFWPRHALPRGVVIVIGVGLILLVAFRLMK